MAKIKAYTDELQSRKLAQILPLDSADMEYILEHWIDEKTGRHKEEYCEIPVVKVDDDDWPLQPITHPCWSLAALLGILGVVSIEGEENKWTAEVFYYEDEDGKAIHDVIHEVATADNPLDACVDLIIKYEQGNRH